MPIVPERDRLDTLRRLGLSEVLVRQSAGEGQHPLFEFQCLGPPFYSYHGAGCPEGPPLAPLWDSGDLVTAVWVRDGRLEFIRFSIEASAQYAVIAHTEQGLWAAMFVDLYENRDGLGPEELRDAALVVGFRFLDRVVACYVPGEVSTFERHEVLLQELIESIDRDTAAT